MLYQRLVPMSSPMTYARLGSQAVPDIMEPAYLAGYAHGHGHGHHGGHSRIAFVTDTRELLHDREALSVDGCSETETPIETPLLNGSSGLATLPAGVRVSCEGNELTVRIATYR